ncbi:MAG: hypothetical protein PUF65_09160 [Lachnospiraceae bacterium]|nr:hypothetical protein [Lachnospiraceae bacterium]
MKKFVATVLTVVLCLGVLFGCGASYTADESTVFILKNGKVVSTDVDDFDENTYDQEDLKQYIKSTIDTYNEENGKGLVELKDLTVKDGKATLTISYASAADYRKFNDIELFTGSVAQALAAGYSFDGDFASVKDGKIAACDAKEFMEDADYKVAVIRGNLNVKVKGTIAYVSVQNTKYVDKQTIAIGEGFSLLETEQETQGTQEAEETEGVAVEDTQAQEVSGAVTDDELLNSSAEDTEVTFDFDEPEESTEAGSELSQVYTYIIYK